MKIYTKLKCPGCGLGTQIEFKKPNGMRPTCISFICDHCKSTVAAQIDESPMGKGNVRFHVNLLKKSDGLIAMEKEEQEIRESERVSPD